MNPEENEDGDELIEPNFVMERLNCDLDQVLNKKLLNSCDLKRRVLSDVAAGIAHLHSHGIVHRDIDPENVLVKVDKVSNFGVSRRREKRMLGQV